jgi:hypothetical protein
MGRHMKGQTVEHAIYVHDLQIAHNILIRCRHSLVLWLNPVYRTPTAGTFPVFINPMFCKCFVF